MKIYVLFIAIILPFPIAAYSNDLREVELLNKLKSEIDNNNYAKVMALAKTYEDEYLGDPNFDFLLGIAALETQQVDLSVFAFERVIANRPTWIDAKLYLARAYYLSSNYQSAIMQC